MSTAVFLIIAVVLLASGVPIALGLGFTSMLFILTSGIPVDIILQRVFMGIDSFPLMAIPFFILAGDIMNRGGIAKRLISLGSLLVGRIKGGLAHITILACMFFAAISGSGVATAAAMGKIMVPPMVKEGYDRTFAAAVVATASPIGPIIPPSIAFVVYGVLTQTSIKDLYLAGIPAGIILGLCLMVATYFFAKKRGYGGAKTADIEASMEEVEGEAPVAAPKKKSMGRRAVESVWAIGTPVIIVGGVFGGIFTPTESAVVAVLYALIVGLFVYKELSFKELPKLFLESAIGSAKIMFIIANASFFAYVISYEKIPQTILAGFMNLNASPFVTLLLINIILLILGCFLESGSIQLLTVPIFLPIIKNLGLDVTHFGIIMTVNTAIGLATPPFGTCLFTAASVSNVSVQKLSRAVIPFVLVSIVALLIITYFPQVVMFLV